jgi:PAS domain S-box-containing protein
MDMYRIKSTSNPIGLSETKFKDIINDIRVGIVLADSTTCRIFDFNNTFQKQAGRTISQLKELKIWEIGYSEKIESNRKKILRAISNKATKPFVFEIQKPNKEVIICEFESRIIRVDDKELIKATLYDITQSRKIENTLRDMVEFNSDLLANSPHPILVHGPDTSIVYANRAFEELTGYYSKDIIGQQAPHPWWTFETGCKTKSDLLAILRKGKTRAEEIFQNKAGQKIIVEINSKPIKVKGKLKYLLANWVDIKQRKLSEKALLDSESFSTSLLDNSPNPILVINPDTSIKYVNPALEELTGFSSKELIGKSIPYPWWAEENVKQHIHEIESFFHRGEGKVEKNFCKKNGDRFWAQVSIIPIKESNEIRYYLSNWVDITEGKNAEDRLAKLNTELRNLSAHLESVRESDRARIAREIHDELGQALASLKMDVRWLADNLDGGQNQLKDLTVSMSKLIDVTVQSVKRICIQLRPKLLDDIGLIGTVEWLTQEFEEATKIKCKICCNLDDGSLNNDQATAIFRILQEALTNIYRHSNATLVSIVLKRLNKNVILKVRDDGSGITQEQISSPRSFGLIGMRERVHYWGGDVKIVGTPKIGTELVVKIPLDNNKIN